MENSIVGREKEITELKKYLSSEQSEFIAVYGRCWRNNSASE